MIRLAKKKEIPQLARLWEEATIASHSFIKKGYWLAKAPRIEQQYLNKSISFVALREDTICGFISFVEKNFIGGLFVEPQYQRQGVGTELLEYAQTLFRSLELDVYARNVAAVEFYMQRGFVVQHEHVGQETHEIILRMRWERDG